MIKANELRIGNLIRWEDPSNDIVQITSINRYEDDVEYGAIYGVNYKETNRDEIGCANLDEFIPIELTPELLVKCGVEKRKNFGDELYVFGMLEISKSSYGTKGYFTLETNISEIYPRLKYLHQLQNLYYCLTGEELTVLIQPGQPIISGSYLPCDHSEWKSTEDEDHAIITTCLKCGAVQRK